MKKILVLMLLMLATSIYSHPPTPPGKWKVVSGSVQNKTGDSVAVIGANEDTLWHGGTVDFLRASSNGNVR